MSRKSVGVMGAFALAATLLNSCVLTEKDSNCSSIGGPTAFAAVGPQVASSCECECSGAGDAG
jgi:hypothetical protein